jgi:hypothetical protein
LRLAPGNAGQSVVDVTDQTLHCGQYGHVVLRVKQRPLPVEPSAMAERDGFGTVGLVRN